MSRFRYAGYDAFTGRRWNSAASTKQLLQQVEDWWPVRHAKDGTIASSSHSKYPQSDHGADPNGIVRAGDVGVFLGQGPVLTEQLRASKDRRIRYVIHARRIFFGPFYEYLRGRTPFKWYDYNGGNPHEDHVHISTARRSWADNNATAWKIGDPDLAAQIENLQKWLNDNEYRDMNGDVLDVDGAYGAKTAYAENAWRNDSIKAVDVELETSMVRVVKSVKVAD